MQHMWESVSVVSLEFLMTMLIFIAASAGLAFPGIIFIPPWKAVERFISLLNKTIFSEFHNFRWGFLLKLDFL